MQPVQHSFPDTEAAIAALRFINRTMGHVFLTGKAGSGKTTFLKNLSGKTYKQMLVVAPTGIAALNAGGVTIHSQFLLPFGMFLGTAAGDGNGNWYTQDMLARRHPLNSARKQVLRTIDLLVIDEVSMLRADLLDAIDYRLKAARGNFRQPFGGVQLLLIGDLFQLPPVVQREEEQTLNRFYKSPWFFESTALQKEGFAYVELDKIFRQSDEKFIDLLNNLRNNQPTAADIDELNRHYKSPVEVQLIKETITLTTHNYKADEINQKALAMLEVDPHITPATTTGEFPAAIYPVLDRLELKVGAQIMFIKNDPDKAYFNGKLATVTSISGSDVKVSMAGTHETYTLKKEVWENKKYAVNPTTNDLDHEVIGTFEQYPVKLAWAITIHKSQGLTFDNAIIDLGKAFADGQVYVALSRLRSLEGLILSTPIDPRVVSTNRQITSFTEVHNRPDQLQGLMKSRQGEYLYSIMSKTFDFGILTREIAHIVQKQDPGEIAQSELVKIRDLFNSERGNTVRFKDQLLGLLSGNDHGQFLERLKKGSEYYQVILSQAERILMGHTKEVRTRKRSKTYASQLSDLDQLCSKKIEEVSQAVYLASNILDERDSFDLSSIKTQRNKDREKLLIEFQHVKALKSPGRKRAGGKKGRKKGEASTVEVTLSLLEQGLSIEAMAKERGLVSSTIETHLAKAVAEGKVSIFKFMSEENVNAITVAIQELEDGFTSKVLYTKLNGEYGYGQLRAVLNHLGMKQEAQ